MADRYWYTRLESVIVDKIKKKSSDYLKKYPNITFTTNKMNTTPTKFPCVQIYELPGTERGMDTENQDVNSVLYYMQINVYSEKSKSIAYDVMSEILDQFKMMRFSLAATQTCDIANGVYMATARVRRTISSEDDIVK